MYGSMVYGTMTRTIDRFCKPMYKDLNALFVHNMITIVP